MDTDTIKLTVDEAIALAGVIDSMGSISIGLDNHNDKQYYYEQYRLSGDEDFLMRLKKAFGGSVSSNGRNCKRIWRITADVAYNMFEALRPHMEERTEIVDICMEFGRTRQELSDTTIMDNKERKALIVEAAMKARKSLSELSSDGSKTTAIDKYMSLVEDRERKTA